MNAVVCGMIGRYDVDDEEALGLYLKLGGKPIFVDIREDKLTEQRKQRALELSGAAGALETSLASFVAANPEFRARHVASLGIHSNDLQRTEVFWDPTGYTLIRGLVFAAG